MEAGATPARPGYDSNRWASRKRPLTAGSPAGAAHDQRRSTTPEEDRLQQGRPGELRLAVGQWISRRGCRRGDDRTDRDPGDQRAGPQPEEPTPPVPGTSQIARAIRT